MRQLLLVLTIGALASNGLVAQSPRPAPVSDKLLDIKAGQVEQEYLRGLLELAEDYESVGNIPKSKEFLRAILKVKPDAEAVKSKLKEFEEAVFTDNSVIVEVDTAAGWTNTGIALSKDRPVRFDATGSYRLILNETISPEGYRSNDPATDYVSGISCGALMGLAATVPAPKGNRRNTPRPFLIGNKADHKPTESGILFLKVNVPPGAKCIGTIKVTVSGNFSRMRR